MRSKDINSITDSLINLRIWRHPLEMVNYPNKIEINLLTGKTNQPEEDSVAELLKEKHEWFINRIKDLNGDIKDFQEAKIKIFLKKEKVNLVYKGKNFTKERTFIPFLKSESTKISRAEN